MIQLIPEDYDPNSLETHLNQYLEAYLTTINKLSTLQPVQRKLISLNLHQCYKISKHLKLSPQQLRIYTSILFQTIINKMPLLFDLQDGQSSKSLEQDWKLLQQRVKENPYIPPATLESLIQEFKKFYFDNFQIFRMSFEENIKPIGQKISLVVDRPQILEPLSMAVEKSLQQVLIDSDDE